MNNTRIEHDYALSVRTKMMRMACNIKRHRLKLVQADLQSSSTQQVNNP